MECFWRLFSHRQPYGDCHQQDPAVFHVCIPAYAGLSYYYIYDPGFLAKYAKLYLGSQTQSVVLFVAL